MKLSIATACLALGILFGTPGIALADVSSFSIISIPGATGGTFAYGINDSKQVVGYFEDGTGEHGFVDTAGSVVILDDPMANPGGTVATGINNLGQVVGYFSDRAGTHGFLYSAGGFITIDDPDAIPGTTVATGINNLGQVVGCFSDSKGIHGFVYSHGVFTTIDDPDGIPGTTVVTGINDRGQVVGYFESKGGGNSYYGFSETDGVFTTLETPDASSYTRLEGINDSGQTVGWFLNGDKHGFVSAEGDFTVLDEPSAYTGAGTQALGLNNTGQVVGIFVGTGGGVQSFVYTEGNAGALDASDFGTSLDPVSGGEDANDPTPTLGYSGDGSWQAATDSQPLVTTPEPSFWALVLPMMLGLSVILASDRLHHAGGVHTPTCGNRSSSRGRTLVHFRRRRSDACRIPAEV